MQRSFEIQWPIFRIQTVLYLTSRLIFISRLKSLGRMQFLSSSIRALLSQRLSILPQQQGGRPAQHDCEEAEEGIAPAVVQLLVHVWREEREAKPRQTPQHRGGANGAGSVLGVRVDEVRLDAQEARDNARAEDGGANVRHDPMDLGLGRPAIPEEADRDAQGAGDHERDAEFGLADTTVAALERAIDAVLRWGADLRAEEEAHAEGDVVQAADADGLVVNAGPEPGEGQQDEIHDAVEVGHVEGEQLDDNLSAEELEGTAESGFEGRGEGPVRVVPLGMQVIVSRLLDKFPLLVLQDDGRVRLLEEEETGDCD